MPYTSRNRLRLLCSMFVLALSFCAMVTSSASAEGRDWNVNSWMTGLFNHGGTITVKGKKQPASSVELGQLAIPGSHDSAADNMGDFADECQDASFFQRNFGKKMTKSYARTQHHDLYTQAKLGVRSFDIRPYYDGNELRTCHTLDAGSFRSMFEGQGGLERFLGEHPKEVAIVNISHFRPIRPKDDEDDPKNYRVRHDRGIEAMANYLHDNVCPRAMDPSVVPDAGSISLQAMWKQDKDYVVVADNDQDLYRKLKAELGKDNCLYNSHDQISGGYAGERKRVSYGDGNYSSTNLWWGMFDEVFCERNPFKDCDYGRDGYETADTVRRATEKTLLDQFREGHKSLHETSYIWAYGNFAGFGNFEAAKFRLNLNDSSLIGATEEKQLIVDEGVFKDTKVRAGLLPYAEEFIKRLEAASDRKNMDVGVGIVNMDAVGRSDLTFKEFIRPLLRIDRALLD